MVRIHMRLQKSVFVVLDFNSSLGNWAEFFYITTKTKRSLILKQNNMEDLELNFKGVEITVRGSYDKGQAGDYGKMIEPINPSFDIEDIFIGNEVVTELLENQMEEIQIKIIEKYYE